MIRPEHPNDIADISAVVSAAFDPVPYSDGGEPAIIDVLRGEGAMTLSLVAEKDGRILGHIAFSAVTIADKPCGWFGLGPVAVLPDHQGTGLGSALINTGLSQLKDMGAQGCVLLGNPAYYKRFGFSQHPALTFAGAPAKNFLALPFTDDLPSGDVTYHKAFYQTA